VPEDLIGTDCFTFTDPVDSSAKYTCEVDTRFPDCGDGFALVSLAEGSAGGIAECTFHGEKQSVSYDSSLREITRNAAR
jgi:hypothetical protein